MIKCNWLLTDCKKQRPSQAGSSQESLWWGHKWMNENEGSRQMTIQEDNEARPSSECWD